MPSKGEKVTDPRYLEALAKARQKALEVRQEKAKENKDIKLAKQLKQKQEYEEAQQILKGRTEKKPRPKPKEPEPDSDSEESVEEVVIKKKKKVKKVVVFESESETSEDDEPAPPKAAKPVKSAPPSKSVAIPPQPAKPQMTRAEYERQVKLNRLFQNMGY